MSGDIKDKIILFVSGPGMPCGSAAHVEGGIAAWSREHRKGKP